MADVGEHPKDIVRAEVKDRSRGLGSVQWYRAILDEAHVIKGHKQVGGNFRGPMGELDWGLEVCQFWTFGLIET